MEPVEKCGEAGQRVACRQGLFPTSSQPAFSSLLAICSPRPLTYADDAESHNSKVSIATWALENYLVHLEKVTSLPIPKGLTPPENF